MMPSLRTSVPLLSLANFIPGTFGPLEIIFARTAERTSRERSIYRKVNRICAEWWSPLAERLHDFLDHLLGVGQEHHGVVAVEQFVVHARIANAAHRSFHEQHCPRFLHVEHGHSVDR